MCAAPFAPPPDSTSPTLGRALTEVVSCEYAVIVIDRSTIAQSIPNGFLIGIDMFVTNKSVLSHSKSRSKGSSQADQADRIVRLRRLKGQCLQPVHQ